VGSCAPLAGDCRLVGANETPLTAERGAFEFLVIAPSVGRGSLLPAAGEAGGLDNCMVAPVLAGRQDGDGHVSFAGIHPRPQGFTP
jgi:hypothetical protein